MIALDTNVLVRILVDDPGAQEQCRQARALLEDAGGAWLSQIVLVETVWVLESVYSFDKADILVAMKSLFTHPQITIEARERFDNGLALYDTTTADFADCLILSNAAHQRFILYTFDRKLSRLHGARRIGIAG